MPNNILIEWQFKNNVKDGLSSIIVKTAEKNMLGKVKAIKHTENNSDYHLQSITNLGLEIYQLYFVGSRFIEYEKPVVLFLAKLNISEA